MRARFTIWVVSIIIEFMLSAETQAVIRTFGVD